MPPRRHNRPAPAETYVRSPEYTDVALIALSLWSVDRRAALAPSQPLALEPPPAPRAPVPFAEIQSLLRCQPDATACGVPLSVGGLTLDAPPLASVAGGPPLALAGPYAIPYVPGLPAAAYIYPASAELGDAPRLRVLPAFATAFTTLRLGDFFTVAGAQTDAFVASPALLLAAGPLASILTAPLRLGSPVLPYTVASFSPAAAAAASGFPPPVSIWKAVAARLAAACLPAAPGGTKKEAETRKATAVKKLVAATKVSSVGIQDATEGLVAASFALARFTPPVEWEPHRLSTWTGVPKAVVPLFMTTGSIVRALTALWALTGVGSADEVRGRWEKLSKGVSAPPVVSGADDAPLGTWDSRLPNATGLPREYVDDAINAADLVLMVLVSSRTPAAAAQPAARFAVPASEALALIDSGTAFPGALVALREATTWKGERILEVLVVLALFGWGKTAMRAVLDLAGHYGAGGVVLNTLDPSLVPWYASLGFDAADPAVVFEAPTSAERAARGVSARQGVRLLTNIPMFAATGVVPMATGSLAPPDVLARAELGIPRALSTSADALAEVVGSWPSAAKRTPSGEALTKASALLRAVSPRVPSPPPPTLQPLPPRRLLARVPVPAARASTRAAPVSPTEVGFQSPVKRFKPAAAAAAETPSGMLLPPGSRLVSGEGGAMFLVLPLATAPVLAPGSAPPAAKPKPAPPAAKPKPAAPPPPAPAPAVEWEEDGTSGEESEVASTTSSSSPSSSDDAAAAEGDDDDDDDDVVGAIRSRPATTSLRELADSPGWNAAAGSALSGIVGGR